MLMALTTSKEFENLIKMADQLIRYQVFLVLEKPAHSPSTAVSHNGAQNSLFGSMLTRLMR